MLTHFSLFSGIGGFDLAAEWAGFTTVGQCEIDEFCLKVLQKHWPYVPKYRDIRELGDIRSDITLITGGFPCQPYSIAGCKQGNSDARHLWPEMFRVVKQSRPDWVVGENVANFRNMGLDDAITDLEGEGYTVRTFNIPACSASAPHQRERLFIVANSNDSDTAIEELDFNSFGQGRQFSEIMERTMVRCEDGSNIAKGSASAASNSNVEGLERRNGWAEDRLLAIDMHFALELPQEYRIGSYANFVSEPTICRGDDGVFRRMDGGIELHKNERLKALGNALVPQQVYPILKAIAVIEHA